MNALTVIESERYVAMCEAIAQCHDVDELQAIADKSIAMAAYYKQIKDEETIQKFKEIRLRAYYRMAQLLCEGVSFEECKTTSEKSRLLRDKFKDDSTVKKIPTSLMSRLIQLAEVNAKDFEKHVGNVDGRIEIMLRETHPEAMKEFEGKINEQKRTQKILERRFREERKEEKLKDALREEHNTALAEVGYTLERADREEMHRVVLLIKKEIADVLRRAAFDKRMTQQEILRRGLSLWLQENGYTIKEEEEA